MTIDFDTQILLVSSRVQMRLGDYLDARQELKPREVLGIVIALQDNGEAVTGRDGWLELVREDEDGAWAAGGARKRKKRRASR